MGYQLSPFEVGQVKAHMEHGLGCKKIAERLYKADGKKTFGETVVVNCMNKLIEDPSWRGERQEGSGAPRKTTAKQDKEIVKWVLDERGKQKVGVPQLKKQFPYLRKLSDTLVEDRLDDADLAWLRRRGKSMVTPTYLEERVEYCRSVKRKRDETLEKWAYRGVSLPQLSSETRRKRVVIVCA